MDDQENTPTDEEVIARRDDALRRALMTPPKPHKPSTESPTRKPGSVSGKAK